jgi:23S rRNA pseudouridine955/2504/2580 synthase
MAMDKRQANMKPAVHFVEVTENNHEQRLDNFLINYLKGVPKSRIYKIIRKGEIRINKGRKDAKYRLQEGDLIRIPPVRVALPGESDLFVPGVLKKSLEKDILFEDEMLLIINKPSGFAVHGGTGVTSGVIEGLRQLRPEARFLELVHRLDRDTSGCLMVAKKRSALRHLHELFRGDAIQKTYLALLAGQWARKKQLVNVPLLKNVSKGGERMVVVSQAGKAAETLFRRIKMYKQATLVEASPKTGRTHQIRVHAAFLNHPIIGDERYGIEEINREFKKRGFKRLFLHAQKLVFKHPLSGQMISVTAPVPRSLQELLADEE